MQQITDTILMVRPANFGYNEQTAVSNTFQTSAEGQDAALISTKAVEEFDAFVQMLRDEGVEVIVAQDTATPVKPDAVFPNNWVSFHEDGTVFLYPMNTPNRRIERREDIIELVGRLKEVNRRDDLLSAEPEGRFLEGTGSMILDRQNGICYACLSPRTDEGLLNAFCDKMGFRAVTFMATDDAGVEVYHTNVVMALGETFVVICLDSVRNMRERALLLDYFEETQKEVIEISSEQMNKFAGNMLQVRSKLGRRILVMSEQAYGSLSELQIEAIENHTDILAVSIYTIERHGGGSARCMMAEVFLPDKNV